MRHGRSEQEASVRGGRHAGVVEVAFDGNVVQDLRKLARAGTPASLMIRVIGERLNVGPTDLRLLAIAYFRVAFGISVSDAQCIGAAAIFPGGERRDLDLDIELEPVIRTSPRLWLDE